MKSLGLAIVGFGAFGERYARAFSGIAGTRIRWVIDPNTEARTRALATGLVGKTSDRLAPACEDPDVDAIIVATPEDAHAAPVIEALAFGKHVLVEKPLATTDADALAMIAAEEFSTGRIFPAMLLRFDLRYARLKQRMQGIAPIRSIHAWRNFDRSLFAQYSRTDSFIENAIHDIDLILWLVGGQVERVHAFQRNTLGLDNPDINWGVMEFDSGVLAFLQTAWLYPEQPHAGLPWTAGMLVMGQGGVLEIRQDAMGFVANTCDGGLRLLDQSAWDDIAGEPRGAFGAMLRHVTSVWRGDAVYLGCTAAEAFEGMRIARRLMHDARSREEKRWT